jgi:hypothetical protein
MAVFGCGCWCWLFFFFFFFFCLLPSHSIYTTRSYLLAATSDVLLGWSHHFAAAELLGSHARDCHPTPALTAALGLLCNIVAGNPRASAAVWELLASGERLTGLLLGRGADTDPPVVSAAAELVARCWQNTHWAETGEDGGTNNATGTMTPVVAVFLDRAAFDTAAGLAVNARIARLCAEIAAAHPGSLDTVVDVLGAHSLRVGVLLALLEEGHTHATSAPASPATSAGADPARAAAMATAARVLQSIVPNVDAARAIVDAAAAALSPGGAAQSTEQLGSAGAAALPLERALSLLAAVYTDEEREAIIGVDGGVLRVALDVLVASAAWRLAEYTARSPDDRAAPQATEDTGMPFLVQAVRLVANAAYRHTGVQDTVRESGGLHAVLSHSGYDVANPLIREWAILAIRNLCEGNERNQAAIAELNVQGVANERELRQTLGVETTVVDGKVKVTRQKPTNSEEKK